MYKKDNYVTVLGQSKIAVFMPLNTTYILNGSFNKTLFVYDSCLKVKLCKNLVMVLRGYRSQIA